MGVSEQSLARVSSRERISVCCGAEPRGVVPEIGGTFPHGGEVALLLCLEVLLEGRAQRPELPLEQPSKPSLRQDAFRRGDQDVQTIEIEHQVVVGELQLGVGSGHALTSTVPCREAVVTGRPRTPD